MQTFALLCPAVLGFSPAVTECRGAEAEKSCCVNSYTSLMIDFTVDSRCSSLKSVSEKPLLFP